MSGLQNSIQFLDAQLDSSTEQFFCKSILNLIKYHNEFAIKLEYDDKILKDYTVNDAKSDFENPRYRHYIIVCNNKKIGVLKYKISTFDVEKIPSIKITKLWTDGSIHGVTNKVIEFIKRSYPEIGVIELDCWYNLPAEHIYKKLGFKPVFTRYTLKIK